MTIIGTEQTMTVKQVSQILGVSLDTVKNCIRRVMPEKMEHGKTTFLNEQECSLISMELKNNNKVLEKLTHETVSSVKNTTTELEEQAIIMQAMQIMQRNYEQAKQRAELAETKLIEQQPKVEFFDTVAESKDLLSMKQLADILNIKGLGRNNLITRLFCLNILDRNRLPYRRYIESGYFKVKETTFKINGDDKISLTTYATQKGLQWLQKKLGGEK